MAIDDVWDVVVRHTFVEVVQKEIRPPRSVSEGGVPLSELFAGSKEEDGGEEPELQDMEAFLSDVGSSRDESKSPARTARSRAATQGTTPISQYLSRGSQGDGGQRGGWCSRISRAMGHATDDDPGQRLTELRGSRSSGLFPSPPTMIATKATTTWRVTNRPDLPPRAAIGFRAEPLFYGRRSKPEGGLRPGQTFLVSEQRIGADGVLHLRLADGRGWVPSRKPEGDVMCTRVDSDDAKPFVESQAAGKLVEGVTGKTTVLFTDVPISCSRDDLIAFLHDEGFADLFNLVYLPVCFDSLSTHGYAILNFVTCEAATTFLAKHPGGAAWSEQRQGLSEHVAHFRDSSLMHEAVPDEFKPALFQDGQRISFPEPTRPPRMPRELKRTMWRLRNMSGDALPAASAQSREGPCPASGTPGGCPSGGAAVHGGGALASPQNRRRGRGQAVFSRHRASSRRARGGPSA